MLYGVSVWTLSCMFFVFFLILLDCHSTYQCLIICLRSKQLQNSSELSDCNDETSKVAASNAGLMINRVCCNLCIYGLTSLHSTALLLAAHTHHCTHQSCLKTTASWLIATELPSDLANEDMTTAWTDSTFFSLNKSGILFKLAKIDIPSNELTQKK